MLSEKYKPINFDNFVGNSQNINLLENWLSNFNINNKLIHKFALISGVSGIGKTLCVELLINKYNLNPIYISPDEKADKEFFQNYINPSLQIEKNIVLKKNVLIINDIDCYDDYGFISNISYCIKTTKIPIIATCNNRYDQSLKPITNNCLDIKFQKPNINEILKFLIPIFKKESILINETDIKKIIEESDSDIRNILNNLQLNNKKMTYSKDTSISQTNIFDLTKMFLSQNIDIKDKNSLYWLNNDLLPLMVHENYPLNTIKMKNEIQFLENIHHSISCLSDIDLFDKEIKQTATNWELSPYSGWLLINSVSNCHSKSKIKFTEFLSKILIINKNKKNATIKGIQTIAKEDSKKCIKSKVKKEAKQVKEKVNKKVTEVKLTTRTNAVKQVKKKKLIIIEED